MPLDFRQLSANGSRAEKVDTARMLLVGEALDEMYDGEDGRWPMARLAEVFDIPTANDVPRAERAAEALRVWRYYPAEFREFAFRHPPVWHLIWRPTQWDDADRGEVVSYFQGYIDERGAWPPIDVLQVRFGRQSNHRPDAAKTPGQETLGGVT